MFINLAVAMNSFCGLGWTAHGIQYEILDDKVCECTTTEGAISTKFNKHVISNTVDFKTDFAALK